MEQFQPIQDLLDRVRARWRRRVVLGVAARAALGASAAIALAALLGSVWSRTPAMLIAAGVAGLLGCLVAFAWAVWPARRIPSDRRVARFIEESAPALDERLVSALEVAQRNGSGDQPGLAATMVEDAARAAASVDPASVITREMLSGAWLRAASMLVLLGAVLFVSRDVVRRSYDATTLALFPSRIALAVTPGDARVRAGSALTVEARLVGNRAPVVAQLLRAPQGSDDWQPTEMPGDGEGRFRLDLEGLTNSFRYRVLAGAAGSRVFDVAVVRPPRVARIDVEYAYPAALALPPRIEEDSGDIYAPAGTDVRVLVHTEEPVATGRMELGDGQPALPFSAEAPTLLTARLRVSENGSYRVALADAEGMSSRGETEYFIRILDDRPPEVHIVRPASDRRVTRLEEVEIAAEAQDDFGVGALDLVYSVKGGPEKVVPLGIPPRSTSVTGRYLMYVEDLDVAPGDFVSYYVRARDLPRGKRPSESRSDIFFLEVKSFEEEFTLAQTQAAMGGGSGNPQLDDLVAAQKEVIVATFKLDRRSRDAQGARSPQDIRAVAKAESDLRVRVEQTASAFRTSTLRDPRRSRATRPANGPPIPPSPPPQPGAPRAGQTMPEEDAMTRASNAMGRAVDTLNALKTGDALPPEMEALNALLKAQSDVRKRQIQQQQAGGGAGGNRSTEDLSSLFDRELAKNQQTNYENRTSAEQKDEEKRTPADQVKDLARRQDELVRRQQDLARNRNGLTPEAAKRELEKLSREQEELRQRAEQVAQQLARQQGDQPQGGQQQGQRGEQQAGQQQPGGEQSGGQQSGGQQGQPGQQSGQQAGQQGQAGQAGQRRPGEGQNARAGSQGKPGSQQLREISEEMRSAASDLGRANAGQASERASRALDRLRELERQLQGGTAEGRRRALGDLQLEARQLADAQRRIASESGRANGPASGDALRRLAGEQERIADRLERMQQGLREQSAPSPGQPGGSGQRGAANLQQAASDAARDIEQQRLAERMQQAAESMRRSADAQAPGGSGGGAPSPAATPRPDQSGSQAELARALDRLADRLNATDRPQDEESQRLADQASRARDLRDRLTDLNRQLEALDRRASAARAGEQQPGSAGSRPGDRGRSAPGQGQSGTSGDAAAETERLRTEIGRQMQDVRQLLNDAQRDQSTRAAGAGGATFEGQGMVLSAPGTEGFKQDFARWQELARQVTLALDAVESSAARRLQEKTATDRLASGADEVVPAEYQQQVDSYFKALAQRKRP